MRALIILLAPILLPFFLVGAIGAIMALIRAL